MEQSGNESRVNILSLNGEEEAGVSGTETRGKQKRKTRYTRRTLGKVKVTAGAGAHSEK